MKTIHTPNYNNKLSNEVFLHIGLAPEKPIQESKLPIRVLIKEEQKSEGSALEQLAQEATQLIEFEADVIDFQRLKLYEIGSVATWVSNGCDREDFINDYCSKVGTIQTDLAIYIIKKVKCQK